MKRSNYAWVLATASSLFLAATAFSERTAASGAVRSPTIAVMKNQRMLVVTLKGDPEKVGDGAMRLLYSAFFRNATEAEKNAPLSPRVRWTLSPLDARKRDWIGNYALPISAGFRLTEENGKALIQDWRYGLVAEILHEGAYAEEPASIALLKDFIARNGFTVAGDFEEEYLQGRGTFYQGAPSGYRTLLRYPVENIQDFPKSYAPLSSIP
jgi:hypothetical protein